MKDMFEETIERVLTDLVTPELIGAAEDGTWPETVWQAVEDNGLAIAAAPETSGGVGGSWHDAFVLARATGRHAVPAPLAETLLVNWLLGLAGLETAQGPATLGAAVGRFENDRFSGTLADVPWGRRADHVLTISDGDAPRLMLLACGQATIAEALNTAREPRDTLTFDKVAPLFTAPLPAHLSLDTLLLGGAMIRSAQIAGGLSRLLETATDYANQRTQFGRAIGKFQAIQHQLALLAEQTAIACAAAELAFAASEDGPDPLTIAAAKTVASDAAGQGATIAHAVLGAIGFTYEHSLHFTTRRLWSWRSEFGGQAFWAQRIGSTLCRGGSARLWPTLISS